MPKLIRKQKIKVKNGAKKFDHGKEELDLIPYECLKGMGEVLAMGKKKYGGYNWTKGIHFSRLISASMRHLGKFNAGQDFDDESFLNHVDHAMVNLAFLKWMYENRKDLDDRGFKKKK